MAGMTLGLGLGLQRRKRVDGGEPLPDADQLLLSGDTQSGADVLLLSGDEAVNRLILSDTTGTPISPVRSSQIFAEIIHRITTAVRLTQSYAEVVQLVHPTVQNTQIYIEVIRSND